MDSICRLDKLGNSFTHIYIYICVLGALGNSFACSGSNDPGSGDLDRLNK